jgi:hypothetical protein
MNEPAPRSAWYWIAILLLFLAGAGALWSPGRAATRSVAIRSVHRPSTFPTLDELTEEFHIFRQEVAQLTREEQLKVWQSLTERTESLSEQTFYAFFSLPESEQRELVDRTIDRMERRRQAWLAMGWQPGAERPPREVLGEDEWNRPFSEMSLEERLALRRDMWEDATSQAYAMRNEFMRLLSLRRQERGLPELYRRWG